MTTPPDADEIAKQAREHAWNWFALHAAQRMQAFNFFVVATAFLIAAYASILEKHPGAAAFLAAVGAWLTLWFNRLDARSRQLVEAGEDALRVSQARLASIADNPHLKVLDAVDERRPLVFILSLSDQRHPGDNLRVICLRRYPGNLAQPHWVTC
jgi:hypothetical protein